jgi:anti-sigma regulatory factor (Ser/Thr protein kinase)
MGDGEFELRRTVPAGLAGVETVSVEMRRTLAGRCSDPDLFASELLLREAVTNAALHGCGLDDTRHVAVVVRLRGNRIVLAVKDEGAGFDWRSGLAHWAEEQDTSGRGLSIYRAYADRVRFNRSGNAVTLVRRLSDRERVRQ